MLVAAFEIHHGVLAAVDLALDAGELREMHRVFQHEGVRRAGVEPDVADVVDFLPSVVGELAEKSLARAGVVPGVGALLLEGLDDAHVRPRGLRRMSTEPSGFSLMKTAIGTPQARWREITQSGRDSIMPVMRFSPCSGTQRVTLMACSARARKRVAGASSMSLSIAMNHCGVLRKMIGFFERHECGY